MTKMKSILLALTATVGISFAGAAAEGDTAPLKKVDWTFNGPFGTFDKQSAQRGFQVFRGSCANCHSLKYFKFRNLADLGYGEDMIKAIAAEYTVIDAEPDEAGDEVERPAKPSDGIPAPFPNQNAARASNNGAYPPDLSLMTKARAHGPDYVYSLMTGYGDAPADVEMAEGMNYNPYFPGAQIAMPSQLFDEMVEYEDGTAATADQHAKDLVNFLHWVAEPKLEDRHSMGLSVMIFLILMSGLTYLVNRRVWKPVKNGETVWDHD